MKRRVCILGEFQTGKSTLVNCLLGEALAGIGEGFHTTQVPTVYQHGTAFQAVRRMSGGVTQPIARDELLNPADGSDWNGVESVEVQFPHSLLEIADLIDTPGLEACAPTDDMVAPLIGESEGLLVLLAAPLGQNTFTDFLRRALPGKPYGVVLNCGRGLPEHPEAPAVKAAEEDVRAWLSAAGLPTPQFTHRVNLLWVHSRLIAPVKRPGGRLDGEGDPLSESGFGSLQRVLAEWIPALPERRPKAPTPARFGYLAIRRKKKKDEVPGEKIKLRTRRCDGLGGWVKCGSLSRGDDMGLRLEEGRYEVQVRINAGYSKAKEKMTVQVNADATRKLVTYAEEDDEDDKIFVELEDDV